MLTSEKYVKSRSKIFIFKNVGTQHALALKYSRESERKTTKSRHRTGKGLRKSERKRIRSRHDTGKGLKATGRGQNQDIIRGEV